MNEDQVKGSIHALEWVKKKLPLSFKSGCLIENELDGLKYRLRQFQDPKIQQDREAREAKRIELEHRVEAQKLRAEVGATRHIPDYTTEPSDFRPLPHFGGRE
jgi:hypothetical protein